MPLFNPIGLPIDLSTDVVGTLAYENGGTSATTQREARQNLGGWRIENPNAVADGTPPSSTGAILGELGFTGYGNLWWRNDSGWRSRFVMGNLVVDGSLEGGGSTEVFISTGDGIADVDNSLILQNKRSDRHSALVCVTHDSVGGAGWRAVFGYGGPDAAVTFASKCYIETTPGTDMVWVNNDPVAGRAIYAAFDGDDNTFRKWKQVGANAPTDAQSSFTLPGVKTQRVMELKSIETTGAGTVSASVGTQTINGTGTAFLTELQIGSEVSVSGLRLIISEVVSDTSANTFNSIGLNVVSQSYVIHSAVAHGQSSDTNLFTAIAANGTYISQVTEAPAAIWKRYAGRAWGVLVNQPDGNAFGISNLTGNSQPFIINGDAANDTLRLTSTGVSITGSLVVSGSITASTKPKFSAHKGGTGQTITAGVWTKVTFATEVFDEGGNYTNSTWTPPSGYVQLTASVYLTATTTGERMLVAIRKNGVEYKAAEVIASSGPQQESVMLPPVIDLSNGTDGYEVYVFRSAGTDISGDASYTFFQGVVLS